MIQFIVVASLAFTNVFATFGTIQPAQYAVDDLHVDFGDYVDVTSSQWLFINVLGDEVDEWDLLLDMSGDFQFSSSSYINVADFQINGECVTKECDLYFGFGVGSKYFTLVTDFDGEYTNGQGLYGIQIYPACGGSLASGDVSTIVSKNRRLALANGSYDNWDQMGGSEHINGDDTWPVTVEIKNNALSNEVTVRFVSATQDLECVYSDTFDQDTDTTFGMIGDANSDGEQLKILSVTIAEENVDICEGMCDASSTSAHMESDAIFHPAAHMTAGHQGPVHMVNQIPSAGIGGPDDINTEPFSIVLSAKGLVIAVLAFMTMILMVIICLLNRQSGVGMISKYKVVSVVGDSEMEEFQK